MLRITFCITLLVSFISYYKNIPRKTDTKNREGYKILTTSNIIRLYLNNVYFTLASIECYLRFLTAWVFWNEAETFISTTSINPFDVFPIVRYIGRINGVRSCTQVGRLQWWGLVGLMVYSRQKHDDLLVLCNEDRITFCTFFYHTSRICFNI